MKITIVDLKKKDSLRSFRLSLRKNRVRLSEEQLDDGFIVAMV